MKKNYLLLSLIASLSLTGCKTDSPDLSVPELNVTPISAADTNTNGAQSASSASEETEPQPPKQEDSQNQPPTTSTSKSYYGYWKIVDFLAPGITALSTDDMEGYIYLPLTYLDDSFQSENIALEDPIYTESVITKEDFADSYQNQVTFEYLNIAADSIVSVSISNSAEFGSTFYVADENTLYIPFDGAFFKASRQTEEDLSHFTLTDTGKAFLTDMCRVLVDFEGAASMDDEFWWNFLFYSYTGASPEDFEMVQIPREDLGFDETAVKVSLEDVQAYTRLTLGVDFPDFKPTFEDMPAGQTSCFFRDGYYYIGVSDFPAFQYHFSDFTAYEESFDTSARATFTVDFEDQTNAGTVTFHLYPADNQNGFTIASKTTTLSN